MTIKPFQTALPAPDAYNHAILWRGMMVSVKRITGGNPEAS